MADPTDHDRRLRDEKALFEILDQLRTVNNRMGRYDRVDAFELSVAISKAENVARGLAYDEDGHRLPGSVSGRREDTDTTGESVTVTPHPAMRAAVLDAAGLEDLVETSDWSATVHVDGQAVAELVTDGSAHVWQCKTCPEAGTERDRGEAYHAAFRHHLEHHQRPAGWVAAEVPA